MKAPKKNSKKTPAKTSMKVPKKSIKEASKETAKAPSKKALKKTATSKSVSKKGSGKTEGKTSKEEKRVGKQLIKSDNEFPVVGVGASAGGLAAFKNLLKAIPEKSGMAFVLVQHLDPRHESLLPELLQKVTEIPVVEISDDIVVRPDHIYIIPSNKMLLSNDGKLELSPRPPQDKNKRNLPIDLFFSSLAEVHKAHAIGIVLSGTASDGTIGLKAIKDNGGVTFAQDEVSAEYVGMPRSAVDAGVVDFVLTPQKMPAKLLEITKITNGHGIGGEKAELPANCDDEEAFRQILYLLRVRKGTDLTYYKQTTIHRRVLRRMAMNKITTPSSYLTFLRENKKEQDVLYQDLLIPVTAFFRDTEIFDNLCKTVFPEILKNKKKTEPLRVWVAGCSTGQEAYSMAICLKEYLGDQASSGPGERLQLFATDLSEPAIAKARSGYYKTTELEGLAPERLKTFFTKSNGGYQANKEIRDICVFAQHNFLKDPPFGKMDLISCRNVLIYMEPYLQKKALTTFHYALNPKGYLLLGKSETAGPVPDLFFSKNKADRLFSPKDTPRKFMHLATERNEQHHFKYVNKPKPQLLRTDFEKTADEVILNKYTPPGVVVNEAMDIVHFRGNTSAFLEQQPGKPSHNLMKMAKPGLAFELRTLLHKATKTNRTAAKDAIPLAEEDGQRLISMEAIPLPNLAEPHFLILFHEQGNGFSEEDRKPGKAGGRKTSTKREKDGRDLRIIQLENELLQSRENMKTITEEQEAANEELQSANEELQSGNEELQSLSEEMETSKEELQSTNEELSVLNQELVNLNEQLTESSFFNQAIVDTIRTPLLVLDRNLRVKSANAAFYKTFDLNRKETENKRIYELGKNQWDIPELRQLLEQVLPEKESFNDFEIQQTLPNGDARHLLLNAREIINKTQNEKLILLAVDDVTTAEIADRRKSILAAIVDSSDDAIIGKTLDGTINSWNKGAEKIFGYTAEEAIGKNILMLLPPELQKDEIMIIDKIKKGIPILHFETERVAKDGSRIPLSLTISPVKGKTGKIIGASKIARDISEQQQARKKIEASERKYHNMIYTSPSLIAIFKGKKMIIDIANDAILESWGKGKGIIGKSIFEVMPEIVEQGFDKMLLRVYKTGKPINMNETPITLIRNGKPELMHYTFVYQALRDMEGKIEGVAVLANEVSPQVLAKMKLVESEEKFHRMAELMPAKITNAGPDGEITFVNKQWLDFSGYTFDEFKDFGYHKMLHPEELRAFVTGLKRAGEMGEDFESEMRFKNKAGDYIWHLNIASPVKDAEGNLKMWIGATTEIQKFKDEVKRKEDFLKLVSHELKTPVTSIKGYVQMLIQLVDSGKIELDSVPVKTSLTRIDSQIRRLTRLISEMLDISRIAESQLALQMEVFDLNALVNDTVEDINFSNTGHRISVAHELNCAVFADKDRIAQVLINFITNAIKYSPEGKKVKIRVFGTEPEKVTVSVADLGIGIDKKELKKIFERFYRVEGQNQETFAGLGIGLFLTKEIIERHHGTIAVESKKEKGSVFCFTLAIAPKTKP